MTGILAACAGGRSATISIADRTVSDGEIGSTATATYQITNDGTVRNHNNTIYENWISIPGLASSYEVRATLSSGATPTSGTLNSWLNCGTSRNWSNVQAEEGQATSTLLIEIRNAGTLVVADSATVTITADWIAL